MLKVKDYQNVFLILTYQVLYRRMTDSILIRFKRPIEYELHTDFGAVNYDDVKKMQKCEIK
jgi:hypothetical protein